MPLAFYRGMTASLSSTNPARHPALRILCVDDEESILFSVKDYFSGMGCTVDTARNRAAAQALIASNTYDVMLFDLRLAGPDSNDGLELAKFTREHSPGSRVMLITAYASPEIQKQAGASGVDRLLSKPCDLKDVDRNLLELVSGAPAPAPTESDTARGVMKMKTQPAAGAEAKPRKKILLVDDSGTVLMMEKMILRDTPFELITARDGQEGVDKAHAEKPDLILMDVMMPRMNGFEALGKLRAAQDTAGVPVIMVTTRAEMENMETGYSTGCNDYVAKPINGLELLAKITNLIGN